MTEFLAMGGYGAWVWSSWGLSAVTLIWLAISSHAALRRAREQARRATGAGQ